MESDWSLSKTFDTAITIAGHVGQHYRPLRLAERPQLASTRSVVNMDDLWLLNFDCLSISAWIAVLEKFEFEQSSMRHHHSAEFATTSVTASITDAIAAAGGQGHIG